MSGRLSSGKIVFRCDASSQIGGGHIMRCLTLAGALAADGAEISFVAAAMPELLAEKIMNAGHQLRRIPAAMDLHRRRPGWESTPLGNEAQIADANATRDAAGNADWVVADHYLLDSCWHQVAREFAVRVLVIDDLANRSYDCDILLDQTFGRSIEDYRERVPDGTLILAGATYAVLRPEFAQIRKSALARRLEGAPVRRILISMGTTDPGGITAYFAERALNAAPNCWIDVTVGPQMMNLDAVQKLAASHPCMTLHVNPSRMANLMHDADLAIGAAGATSWERCCLGLPSIVLILAENQSFIAESLAREGAHVAIGMGREKTVNEELSKLIASPGLRAAMAKRASTVTDGLGTQRVIGAMETIATGGDLHG